MQEISFKQKVMAIIFGHAVGDAVGGPAQFEERDVRDRYPVTGMMAFNNPHFPKGAWSDDTSLSLCAMDALTNHGLNFKEVMKNFIKWLFNNEFTPTGITFDVGRACFMSIAAAQCAVVAEMETEGYGRCGENENGNGSLMRVYPFSLYLYCSDYPLDGKIAYIHRASALTHAHPRSCVGCGIYSFVLWELLKNPTKQGIKVGLHKAYEYYQDETELKSYHRLFDEGFGLLPRDKIKSSGYVVDTLEAAAWCALTTENFRDCILKAVNLGLDTDSVGAVAGSLAGLMYGYEGIPEDWRNSLIKKEYIEEIGKKFSDMLCSQIPRLEYKRLQDDINSVWNGYFFLIKINSKGREVFDLVLCNGNTPFCWHNAEDYPFCGSDEMVVVFEYQHKLMANTAINGLAFTNYKNYKKYLCACSEKISDNSNTVAPLWDYTAIYKIPDFSTFREARDYLVKQFMLKAENVLERDNLEDRKYTCGLIQ